MRHFAVFTTTILAGTLAFAQIPVAPKPAAPAGAPAATGAAAPPPAPTGPHAKSPEEAAALQALGTATDLDGRIKAAENIINNFPNSDYKSAALFFAAEGYRQKGDHAKAITLAEQAAEFDAKSYDARLLLAGELASTTRNADLDMDERMTKAAAYANEAIALVKKTAKPNPQVSDADWANAQMGAEAEGYQSLGMIMAVRQKYDDAIVNFQKSLDMIPDPLTMIRAGRAMIDAKKYDQAITWFDKALAAGGQDPTITRIATSDKARATALKGK